MREFFLEVDLEQCGLLDRVAFGVDSQNSFCGDWLGAGVGGDVSVTVSVSRYRQSRDRHWNKFGPSSSRREGKLKLHNRGFVGYSGEDNSNRFCPPRHQFEVSTSRMIHHRER